MTRLHCSYLFGLCLVLAVTFSRRGNAEENKSADPAQKPPSSRSTDLFPAGQSIPVSPKIGLAQIGRATDYKSHRPIIMGTANVFGNGPYDLFIIPDRLLPFRSFDENGIPTYKAPLTTKGHGMNGTIITGEKDAILGIFSAGKVIKVCKFDRKTLTFEEQAASSPLDIPGDAGSAVAAYIEKTGKLQVYFTIADGLEYRPPASPDFKPRENFPYFFDASYMPFDGAGFWRGNIHRRSLYHARFDSLKLKKIELVERASQGPGEFLFDCWGLTTAKLGKDQPPCLISADHLGMMRYFEISPLSGKLTPHQFVNNEANTALRHVAINSSVKAIPDQLRGWSNLIVGDSVRLWFYEFTGKLSPNEAPIYKAPVPLMAEGVPISLGELPVISSGDVDRDGLIDLIVGNDAGQLLFLKNIGSKGRPEFANAIAVPVGGRPLDIKAGYRSNQGPAEAMWGYTCPTLYDWNGDGRLDVVINTILGDYLIALQKPSAGIPEFTEPRWMYCDGLQLHLAWRTKPAVTDWGLKDGRVCLITLDEKNELRYFWRIDNENVERGELLRLKDGTAINANFNEAAGQTGRAKLVAHDWDQDGVIDLLMGVSRRLKIPASKTVYYPSHFSPENKASVLLLRNVGTNEKPVFDYARLLEFDGHRISLGIHCCSPAPIDFGRGVTDLLVSEENGTIHYYPREAITVSAPAP
jgi:hypothetical protein